MVLIEVEKCTTGSLGVCGGRLDRYEFVLEEIEWIMVEKSCCKGECGCISGILLFLNCDFENWQCS